MNRRTFVKAFSLCVGASLLPLSVTEEENFAMLSTDDRKARQIPKVVRVCERDATTWDYEKSPYINYINYDKVKEMLLAGLLSITGASDAREAWRRILDRYEKGDKIAIKPNFNNTEIGYSKAIMTSPQVVAAIVESLIHAGCPAADIVVFDLTAKESGEIMPWLRRFPVQVVFRRHTASYWDKISSRLRLGEQSADAGATIKMRSTITDPDDERRVICYVPKVLTGARHLINVPVYKGHQFVLQSSALKNHFGTVRFSNRNSYPVVLHGNDIGANIVDVNRNDHIRMKTRIIIVDGLFGAGCFARDGYGRLPTPWKTLSSGPTPNSLFLSVDPVAVESVLADFINSEQIARGFEPYSHNYLHDAMELGLGVHEHRGADGRYSQIEYRELIS